MKPLLVLPSPRDIPEVKESVDSLDIDKLWIKYYPQLEAYNTARDWFLNSDYTHFIIHPDDLLVTKNALDNLLLSAIDRDNSVISGWCINTIKENWTQLNQSSISYNLKLDLEPHSWDYEMYDFIPVPDLETLLQKGTSIIKVKWSGFVICCIPRAVVEKIPFREDHECCPDSTFSLDLYNNNIEQFCNLLARCQHLRREPSEIQVGKKPKEVYFGQTVEWKE